MISPEIANFPPPKTVCSLKHNISLNSVTKTIEMNNFYKSLVITCPDDIQTPSSIQELLLEDSDYYKIIGCTLTEFVEPFFIENFVKKGKIYCLSANRDCMVANCVAITPDGTLTLHLLDFIFQKLGFEGQKRPYNFYEVKIDLKNLKQHEKVMQGLAMLETFDLYLIWEPHEDHICPSSVAKYFYDRNIKVTSHSLTLNHVLPDITEIPSIKDIDIDEMVEWIGMLTIGGELNQPETYISTYSQPESEHTMKSTRISILIVKGFVTPNLITNLSYKLSEYCKTRELNDYWNVLSIQSYENSLWQWSVSAPKMFQAHDSSLNVFFSTDGVSSYSVGQIKYT